MDLFIDIETVKWELDGWLESLRDLKYREKHNAAYWLHAEFWKILCISVWYKCPGTEEFKTKSFSWEEKTLLVDFFSIIKYNTCLIWHNILWFDLPFITKRALIHGLKIPAWINTTGKKPWEVVHKDTMILRKFTWWSPTSLDVLCRVLWIDTPKDGIVTWEDLQEFRDSDAENKLEHIVEYCERDVVATYEVYQKMKESLWI